LFAHCWDESQNPLRELHWRPLDVDSDEKAGRTINQFSRRRGVFIGLPIDDVLAAMEAS
jgi:hypothetical protein